jgi:hypothetical protein
VPPSAPRRLVALFLAAVAVVVVAAGAGAARSAPATSSRASRFVPGTLGESANPTIHRSLQTALTWRGGPILTSTGETVTVYVSDSLPTVTPEQWAEFIAHLDHGPEISKLTMRIVTLDELQQICGARALGCYGDNQLISIGETMIDGTTPEEVVRHEYGHHIAFNRANPPWLAVDWGPKFWASAVGVCGRVRNGIAYPGDESVHYDQNPGEAWAETYRVLEERKVGIVSSSWQIVSPTFFPNGASLTAALRDVTQPWSATTSTTYRTQFTKTGKRVWIMHVQTPLDGNLAIRASIPRGGLYDVAVLAPNRRTVMKHTVSSGGTARMLVGVCGQRSLYLRVTDRSGTAGRVAVTASAP